MSDEEIILLNRAKLESIHHLDDNCFEQTVFLFNSDGAKFSVGLTSILECLENAIKNGELPKLPSSWCYSASDRLPVDFDHDVFYDDYSEAEKWKSGCSDEKDEKLQINKHLI